ncbi:transcription factor S-II-domain-containing protein [Gorgonomyces haynaldii]|nr:transcription factor S-II-domain-containing protein [Gorgonomyces haynaldii]
MSKTTKLHSLVFCHACGALLDPPTGSETHVECHCCLSHIDSSEFESIEVVSKSKPEQFPHRPKDLEIRNTQHLKDGATIDEKCPKCGAPEMVFHTAQLRSADEGQTIFYTCVQCGYKEKLNS